MPKLTILSSSCRPTYSTSGMSHLLCRAYTTAAGGPRPSDVRAEADSLRRRESVMRIVDAQIHLWGSGLPSNMAHRQVTSFTTDEALGLMNEAGVDAAVIHPPGWDPNSTEMAFKAVRDFPGRFAILGAFPLNQPDKRAPLATWRG